MEKHYKFTKHFAERFVQRFDGTSKDVNKVKEYFDKNVLQCVFDCNVYGNPQRVKIENTKSVLSMMKSLKRS